MSGGATGGSDSGGRPRSGSQRGGGQRGGSGARGSGERGSGQRGADSRGSGERRSGQRQPRGGPSPARSRQQGGERGRPSGPDREAPTGSRSRNAAKIDTPPIPDEITGEELDPDTRRQLRTLPKGLAEQVARHLVQAGLLLDETPEDAYRHARAALRLASRVPAVREAAGLTAYATGRWAEALAELRAARRMTGVDDYLPVMADCERGLGRPERALTIAGSPEAGRLDQSGKVELRIVAAGARRDMGQLDAAVLTLQLPALKRPVEEPWWPRLAYAYADALLASGRAEEARTWFQKAADHDVEDATDASERLERWDPPS